MECVTCGGTGCRDCEQTGRLRLTQCPLAYVSRDIWQGIEYAELFEKGLPPVAGGVADQAKVFIDIARFIWQEQAYWKGKLGIMDHGV
ncbi:MAG: hypothetical protein ACYTEQ_05585 [Planctomycetota bacterium]|jgi:hypothetical protein